MSPHKDDKDIKINTLFMKVYVLLNCNFVI